MHHLLNVTAEPVNALYSIFLSGHEIAMKIDSKVGLMGLVMEIADCAASWVIILKRDRHGGWMDGWKAPPTLRGMVTPIENPPAVFQETPRWSGIGNEGMLMKKIFVFFSPTRKPPFNKEYRVMINKYCFLGVFLRETKLKTLVSVVKVCVYVQ